MNNNNTSNNNQNNVKKNKINELLDSIEKNDLSSANSGNMNNFYTEIQNLRNNKINENHINEISQIYNDNTHEKKRVGNIKFSFLNDIKLLKTETKNLEKEINLLSTQERSLKTKIKEEIYNDKDTKDYNQLYMIISSMHIIVFLLVLIACIFPIINSVIISCVAVFMYVIMISIMFVKFKKDQYRDAVDYNTFNLEEKDSKVCRINRKN